MNNAILTDKIEKSISENHKNILVRNFFGEDNGNGISNESAFDDVIGISSEYIHKEELHAEETANQIQTITVKATGIDYSSALKVIWNLKKWQLSQLSREFVSPL